MQKAFTLAEVLITLAIIGVVVALTLPALISNYQKQIWVTQLKQEFSIVSQGFKIVIVNDHVDNLYDTELFNSIEGDNIQEIGQDKFVAEFKKYFKVIDTYESLEFPYNKTYSYLNKKNGQIVNEPTKYFVAIMNNGSYWFLNLYKRPKNSSFDKETIQSLGGNLFSMMGQIFIDINGEKGPNVLGRDLFQLIIGHDGTIFPANGVSHSIFAEGANWENGEYYWRSKPQCDPTNLGYAGYGCAGRVIEEGWKMTY